MESYLEQLKVNCPGRWVVVHNGGLQDDNGPPCFDTLADAERLAAKKGIIESADLLNLPDCENPVINHENLAVYAIKVGEH